MTVITNRSSDVVVYPKHPRDAFELKIRHRGYVMGEAFSSLEDAQRRKAEAERMIADDKVIKLRPYTNQPIDFEGAITNERNGISAACRLWNDERTTISGDLLAGLEHLDLLRRTIVLQVEDEGALAYRFIGFGFSQRFGDWPRQALGDRIDNDVRTDPLYTAWVNSHYNSVFKSDEPRRDYIDAVFYADRPHPGKVRSQYERAVMPCRLSTGRPGILVVSDVRPGLLPLVA